MSVGLIADPKIVQFAYDIVIPSANEHLKDIEGSTASIAYQPISHAWLQAARNSGGDAIDLDPAKGSFVGMYTLIPKILGQTSSTH